MWYILVQFTGEIWNEILMTSSDQRIQLIHAERETACGKTVQDYPQSVEITGAAGWFPQIYLRSQIGQATGNQLRILGSIDLRKSIVNQLQQHSFPFHPVEHVLELQVFMHYVLRV